MPPGSARRPGRAALRGRGKRAGRLGRWLAIGIAILLGATAVGRCLEPEAAVPPRWLAVPLDAAAAAVVFRRDFDSPEGIQEAELRLAADYARATVRINGRTLIRVEPYCPLQTRAATGLLRRGRNRLEVALEPVAGRRRSRSRSPGNRSPDRGRRSCPTPGGWWPPAVPSSRRSMAARCRPNSGGSGGGTSPWPRSKTTSSGSRRPRPPAARRDSGRRMASRRRLSGPPPRTKAAGSPWRSIPRAA